jgi:hypothetical protein
MQNTQLYTLRAPPSPADDGKARGTLVRSSSPGPAHNADPGSTT